MVLSKISISHNRVAVVLEGGKSAQFVVWDLEESRHAHLENQLRLAFSISENFSDIETHLQINGFEATLEDIY